MKIPSIYKSSSGFSLVEIIITTALISTGGIAITGLWQLSQQDSLQLSLTRVIVTARAQIEAAFKNPAAWQKTLMSNSNMSCLTSGSGCSLNTDPGSDGFYKFILYNADSQKISYDDTDATTRYARDGGFCLSGIPSPSKECPIQYSAQWKPLCNTYPCINPTMDIKVSLKLDPDTLNNQINPLYYGFSTVKETNDSALESACKTLNGIYNSIQKTCYPKYAGKSCSSIGKPNQIITAVSQDGGITCGPLYKGTCSPGSQYMSGVSSSGSPTCSPRIRFSKCPVDCSGRWSNCSASCGIGTQTYEILTPSTNGGKDCTNPKSGDTQLCSVPTPCENVSKPDPTCNGTWSACSAGCGGGKSYYTLPPGVKDGVGCGFKVGDQMDCNQQACGADANCILNWSSCDPLTGQETASIVQAAQGNGRACPATRIRECKVDCVGSWTECSNGYKTYIWNIQPRNGGAICSTPNGRTDNASCSSQKTRYRIDSYHLVGYNVGNGCGGRFIPTPSSILSSLESLYTGDWTYGNRGQCKYKLELQLQNSVEVKLKPGQTLSIGAHSSCNQRNYGGFQFMTWNTRISDDRLATGYYIDRPNDGVPVGQDYVITKSGALCGNMQHRSAISATPLD